MRRSLIGVFVAVSSLIVVAFVIPLGFLVQRTAEDRAVDSARADAAALVPVVAVTNDPALVESALNATASGRAGRTTIVFADGSRIGRDIESSDGVAQALRDGRSSRDVVTGGSGDVEVVSAVATGTGDFAAVRVLVPESELHRGRAAAWAALTAVGAALIGIAVFAADRLARTVVQPAERLAKAAHRLGGGDLDARVEPDGPDELIELAEVFNDLGAQVGGMLERERALVAELSHRLRTPLTKLRLRLDRIESDTLATELRADVDEVTNALTSLIGEARGAIDRRDSAGCDLREVVERRAAFWRVLAEDQQRSWTPEFGPDPLPVALSEADLASAIDILFDNVFSHTAAGLAITVGCDRQGGSALVWVADGGDGFDETAIEPGVSGGSSSGVGLAIVRETVSRAAGILTIERSDLGGAHVSLSMPLVS